MKPMKIPRMQKEEYDSLIKRQFIARIAFSAAEYPYIAPFMYVFDGRYIYFLSTKYGRKIDYFRKNPHVSVEIEEYSADLSMYRFVSLQGYLEEITDPVQKKKVREQFTTMVRKKELSRNILNAFGHDSADPIESIVQEDRSLVWQLRGVKDIVALKNS